MAATTRRADVDMPLRKAEIERRRTARMRRDSDMPPQETEMQQDDPDNVALACFEEGFLSDKEPAELWGVK